jgi:hypothetical protein
LCITWGALSVAAAEPPADAGAPEAALRVRLRVVAPSGCVSVASIAERIGARSSHIELVQHAAGTPTLDVVLHGDEQRGLHAQLQVLWSDGRRSERQLDARSCRELSDVLAFLIVLTLDPTALASTTPPRETDAQTTQAGASPAEPARDGTTGSQRPAAAPTQPTQPTHGDATVTTPAERSDSTAAAPSERPVQPPPAASGGATEPAPSDTTAQRNAAGWLAFERAEWGLLAQLLLGAAPSAMPGLGLQLAVALRGTELWAPALQLRMTRHWLQGATAAYGVADFQLDVLRLDVCPLALRLADVANLTGRACLETGLGSLTAHGRATYAARTRTRLWADSGVTVALSADLGRFWQVGVNAGLVLPWRRDRFAFRPEEFHRVDAVCRTFDLRVGVRFP